MRRYCAPLSRPTEALGGPAPDEFGGFAKEMAFLFPFALEISGTGQVLRRCGTEREDHLPSADTVEGGVSAGIVSWGQYVTRLRARGVRWHGPIYRLETLRSRRFPVVEPEPGESSRVANTATTVYASRRLPARLQPDAFRGPPREEIYAARMP
jgi:hypothetical protein